MHIKASPVSGISPVGSGGIPVNGRVKAPLVLPGIWRRELV